MKNILFLCEGSTEIFLLYKILKKEFSIKINKNLEENGNLNIKKINGMPLLFAEIEDIHIYIGNIDGEAKLNNYIDELCDSREFFLFNKILFFMDADYQEGLDSGFTRTKNAISDTIHKIKSKKRDLVIEYFISPDNKNDGMTENILIEALTCKDITCYIKNTVIKEIKKMEGHEIRNEAKSTFMMIAATQNPLRGNAPSFISSCYNKLDKENLYFQKIFNFIKENLDIRS